MKIASKVREDFCTPVTECIFWFKKSKYTNRSSFAIITSVLSFKCNICPSHLIITSNLLMWHMDNCCVWSNHVQKKRELGEAEINTVACLYIWWMTVGQVWQGKIWWDFTRRDWIKQDKIKTGSCNDMIWHREDYMDKIIQDKTRQAKMNIVQVLNTFIKCE